MDKNNIIWIEVNKLHPSQFYINEDSINFLRSKFDINLFEPIPVIKLDEHLVMTDGHTRACYLVEKGFDYIPIVEETQELDWEAYRINVQDCEKKGIFSALDLTKCIVPKDEFQIKWDTYCDDVHDRLSYLRNPCDYSALPYWKEITFNKPQYIKIYNEKEWLQLSEDIKNKFKRIDKFFRTKHPLTQIDILELPRGYEFRTFNPDSEEDYDLALEIIKLSYDDTDITKDILKGYIKSKVYDESLWIFIDEINNGKKLPVAFGMADFDPLMKEGILEWIQVLLEYRGKGFGTFLVKELLNRLKTKAEFVTVSGDCNNKSNPIKLYRKCGFIGNSIWYIAYEE